MRAAKGAVYLPAAYLSPKTQTYLTTLHNPFILVYVIKTAHTCGAAEQSAGRPHGGRPPATGTLQNRPELE